MSETTKDRLQQFIDLQGISGRSFSEKIGASSNYFNVTKTIGSDYLEKIAQAFPDLDMHWVITGKTNNQFSIDEQNHIGSNIRHLRINAGYTTKQCAELLEIEADQLLSYEAGIEVAPPLLIAKICKLFLGNTTVRKFYKQHYNSYPLKDPDLENVISNETNTTADSNLSIAAENKAAYNTNPNDKYYDLLERCIALLEQIKQLKETG